MIRVHVFWKENSDGLIEFDHALIVERMNGDVENIDPEAGGNEGAVYDVSPHLLRHFVMMAEYHGLWVEDEEGKRL